jgi:hypothetical protein
VPLSSDLDGIDDRAYQLANEHQVKHHLNDDKDSGALAFSVMSSSLCHFYQIRSRRPRDQIGDHADHGNKDDEDEPQRFGDAAVVPAPEVVDEDPDNNENPQDETSKYQHRPKDTQ